MVRQFIVAIFCLYTHGMISARIHLLIQGPQWMDGLGPFLLQFLQQGGISLLAPLSNHRYICNPSVLFIGFQAFLMENFEDNLQKSGLKWRQLQRAF